VAQDENAALFREVLAAPDPAAALREALRRLEGPEADARAAALFESVFYQLPPFADPHLPAEAARCYARLGCADAALLLGGLAIQMQPDDPSLRDAYLRLRAHFLVCGRPAEAAALERRLNAVLPGAVPLSERTQDRPDALSDEAEAIVASYNAGEKLLLALERLANVEDWLASARLFEALWHRLPPLTEYWVFARMGDVYARLGRADASFVMAMLTVQLDPSDRGSVEPHRRLFRRLSQGGRIVEAATLALRQHEFCPLEPILNEAAVARILDAAGPDVPRPRRARQDHEVCGVTQRPAQEWPCYGGSVPYGLKELRTGKMRPPIMVTELHDAELWAWEDSVAVFDAHGQPQPDLSVRAKPVLLRRRMQEARGFGLLLHEAEIDEAVLLNDEFPPPNVCHFLFDHASRLVIYRRVGVELDQITVIGPALRTEYQRLVAERFGVRAWHSTDAPTRLRVKRLLVSSNCRALRHPAHWGTEWIVQEMRALFDLSSRGPARRLLVSRRDVSYRRIVNEAEILAVLEPLGFEVIVPGRLPFTEQIAAFRDASHIVGPHGGAFGNILFCTPGTHMLEIFHPHYGTWAYAMAAPPLGLNYASMIGRDGESETPEFNDPALGFQNRVAHSGRDIRVDIGELRRWLRDIGLC
jgi:tetratricopeptide (TPR) repeat protein